MFSHFKLLLLSLLFTLTLTVSAASCPFSHNAVSLAAPRFYKRWFTSPPPKPAKPGKKVILTPNAPAPLPVFSQGLVIPSNRDLVYVSGTTGVDPATGLYVEGTVGNRTTQALQNIQGILRAAGSDLANAIKINVYLSDWKFYDAMNAAYAAAVPDPKPVRTTAAVRELPKGTDVEIDCIAYL